MSSQPFHFGARDEPDIGMKTTMDEIIAAHATHIVNSLAFWTDEQRKALFGKLAETYCIHDGAVMDGHVCNAQECSICYEELRTSIPVEGQWVEKGPKELKMRRPRR